MGVATEAKKQKMAYARALYESGMSYKDISETIGVPMGSLRRWKSEQGWPELRMDIAQKKREETKKRAKSKKRTSKKEMEFVRTPEQEALENANGEFAKPTHSIRVNTRARDNERGLSAEEEAFCFIYAHNLNQVRSYMKAFNMGDDQYMAAQRAVARLMQKPEVEAEITRQKQIKFARISCQIEDLLQKAVDVAVAQISDFVDVGPNGIRFKNFKNIDSYAVVEVSEGKAGQTVKLMDRKWAFDFIAKYGGYMTEEQRAKLEHVKADTDRIKQSTGGNEPAKKIFIVNDLPEDVEDDDQDDITIKGFQAPDKGGGIDG